MRLSRHVRRRLVKKIRKWHGGLPSPKMLALRVGDIIQDCDAFNHRIVRIEYHKIFVGRRKKGYVIVDMIVHREDGDYFCTCSIFPVRAWTVEEIERHHTEHCVGAEALAWITEQEARGWNYDQSREIGRLLAAGAAICTPSGLPIPALYETT